MGDEIGLEEPRAGLVPLGESPDGDLSLQDAPRLRAGSSLELETPALWSENPVDRRRGHPKERLPHLGLDLELTGPLHGLDDLRQERG